jgi:hypothetical protein
MTRRDGQPTRLRPTLLVVLAFTVASGGAAAAAPPGKVIGHAVRLKGTKIFYAHGTATRPRTISARVVPNPGQPVKVQWSVACQKANHFDPAVQLDTAEKLGETSVRGTATVELTLPYARPRTCVATVYATLHHDGNLVLRLLQT